MIVPRNKRLYDLLLDLFTAEQLRRFLSHGFPWGQELLSQVPSDLTSPAHIVQAVIDELGRQRYLDAAFFAALVAERPRWEAEIAGVAEAFGASLARSGPASAVVAPAGGGVGLGRYDAQRYVPWPREEDRARDVLADGVPLVIWGPPRVGKTWFIGRLLDGQRALASPPTVVHVDLDALESAHLRDYGAFLQALLRLALRRQPGAPDPSGVEDSIDFEDRLLAWLERLDRVVLAIDRADRIRGCAFNDDFWAFFRARCKGLDAPWDRLQLVLGISAAPEELTRDRNNSPFENMGERVALRGFDDNQTARLARQYGRVVGQGEAASLRQRCEGNPYRLRRALYDLTHGGC